MMQRTRSNNSAAHIEVLEARALFSTTYAATDLSRFVPKALQGGLNAIAITNSGLVTLGGSYDGVFNTRGHRLYPAPAGFQVAAVNNAGDDVLAGSGGIVINFGGQSHAVDDVHTDDDDSHFVPYSINSLGQVAGSYTDNYHPQTTLGAFQATGSKVIDAQGTQVTNQGMVYTLGPALPAFVNDAGAFAFSVVEPSLIDAVVFNSQTQAGADIGARFPAGTTTLVAGLNQSGQVVGRYMRGRRTGVFSYDASSDVLTKIPAAAGVTLDPGSIGDGGAWVGSMSEAVRTRGHVRSVSRAVLFRTDGTIEDLSAGVSLPEGATLTGAQAVNASGQILATGMLTDGERRVYLLTPSP